MQLDPQFESALSKQDYTPTQSIDGVEIVSLQLHTDDGGNFLEIARLQDGVVAGLKQPFPVAQLSMSIMMPGVVKAYHMHERQDDLWFVPPFERLLVNMHDLRADSPTLNAHQRLVLGGGKAQLLRIPAGVAHGAKNCYAQPMHLFYATSSQFDVSNPDELRLNWDHFGKDVWDLTKG